MTKQIVSYISKAGKPGNYYQLAEAKDKFNAGKKRVRLGSLDGQFDFWVDADKVTASSASASTSRRSGKGGCGCHKSCCRPCQCDYTCNCKGGNIYDC